MITHLFKLMWNKKGQNFLLITEMLVSFMVMFAVFTLVVYYYQGYRTPMGFDYENVWSMKYNTPDGMSNPDSIATFRASVKQMIKSMPQVEEVSFSNTNIPFGDTNIGTSITYDKNDQQTNLYTTDDNYKDVLHIQLAEGRWFSKQDVVVTEKPIIINQTLKENLFGKNGAVGKLIEDRGVKNGYMKIIGVIADIKDKGDYVSPQNSFFERIDTATRWGGAILIKVKPTADAAFESKLYKMFSNIMKNVSVEIKHLDKERITANQHSIGPVIILMIIAGFLIINVALGLFGVLWYNISRRKSEIGLRRAVGASGNSILKQLLGEAMVLSTFSLIIGLFFALQFPLLHVFNLASNTYLAATGLSVVFIYLLVIICALYPGKQAAAIYPAMALHED